MFIQNLRKSQLRKVERMLGRSRRSTGQVQAQVLIYVLAIIIASGLLLYGYRVVSTLLKTQDDILLLQFERDLSSKVREKSYEFRSVEKIELRLPPELDEVCFADLSFASLAAQAATKQNRILVGDSLEDSVRKNVFILQDKQLHELFDGGSLSVSVPDKLLCIPVEQGQVRIQLTSLGRSVEISSW